MKIIIGLGNPGKEYAKTRHNVGFGVIDKVHDALEFDDYIEKSKFKALISEGDYNNEKVILVKPLTFMNLSGKTAHKLVKFYKISLEDLWVIYDDLDFEVGKFKIKEKGSAGSHNGMESIISMLGNKDFPRFRIGIDSRSSVQKVQGSGRNYVLGKFSEKDEKTIFNVIDTVAQAIIHGLEHGIVEAMNKFNTK